MLLVDNSIDFRNFVDKYLVLKLKLGLSFWYRFLLAENAWKRMPSYKRFKIWLVISDHSSFSTPALRKVL